MPIKTKTNYIKDGDGCQCCCPISERRLTVRTTDAYPFASIMMTADEDDIYAKPVQDSTTVSPTIFLFYIFQTF